MKIAIAVLASAVAYATVPAPTARAAESPPRWAYPENNPTYKPPVDDGNLVRVPNSTAGYTWSQLRDRFIAPVWHPGDHRPLPATAAEALAIQCRELAEEADISPKWGNFRFDPSRTYGRYFCCAAQCRFDRPTMWYVWPLDLRGT